jgi:hypothetical protein
MMISSCCLTCAYVSFLPSSNPTTTLTPIPLPWQKVYYNQWRENALVRYLPTRKFRLLPDTLYSLIIEYLFTLDGLETPVVEC